MMQPIIGFPDRKTFYQKQFKARFIKLDLVERQIGREGIKSYEKVIHINEIIRFYPFIVETREEGLVLITHIDTGNETNS